MSHISARICAEHKAIQLRCRCPEPIIHVIEEECKHGELTDQSLFWDGSKIVRGRNPITDDPQFDAAIASGDYKIVADNYLTVWIHGDPDDGYELHRDEGEWRYEN